MYRDIYVTGEINYDMAESVIRDIRLTDKLYREGYQGDTPVSELKHARLIISSPGGDVYAGAAIMDAIKDCACTVDTHAIGCCASTAILIFRLGKKRTCGKYTTFGIHGFMADTSGYVNETYQHINHLTSLSEDMLNDLFYSENFSEEELESAQNKTYYFRKDEAFRRGVINHV